MKGMSIYDIYGGMPTVANIENTAVPTNDEGVLMVQSPPPQKKQGNPMYGFLVILGIALVIRALYEGS